MHSKRVKVTWIDGKPKVFLDGKDVTFDIVAGGLSIDFPDDADYPSLPRVAITFLADLELEVDAEVVTS